MLKEIPLVLVNWIDPECSDPGWQDKDGFYKWCNEPLKPVQTVGWLVRDNDDIVVVLSTMGDDVVGEAHKIPKSLVVSIEKLTREVDDGGNLPDQKWSVVEHPRTES